MALDFRRGSIFMKVTSTSASKGAGRVSKPVKKRDVGDSFTDTLQGVGASDGALGTPEIAGSAGVDGILAAQNAHDSTDDRRRRQKLVAHGDDLLDRLDDLRIGILLGRFSKEKLTDLAQLLRRRREQSDDTALDDILAEIELRAEVEIAKYTRRA
tara:strand:+ start:67 stop:534 length:468 start_codon:yes stop_codon:yes gene_type:complete